MQLNLIADPWIPVRCKDGSRRIIVPWQMADADLAFPDWPRADLNIACLELLIGMVFLADPPEGAEEWELRQRSDPERLRENLAAFAPAFNLFGDGPRFLQDIEPLQGEPNSPDMLFIDSAGGNTARNNADVMVHRGRYPALSPALAAMALYAFQAFAPSGGAGNRTSMRGGGPMVTLVHPERGLWPLIWANVPNGKPTEPNVLPWMSRTRTSDAGEQLFPEHSHPAEAFFGMPRRLRLVAQDERVTGVIQRPYGTNYAGWEHPLSPYYRLKPGAEWLPKHPSAGQFGYRNWLGVVAAGAEGEAESVRRRSLMLRHWRNRGQGPASVIVAGWVMDNMKPRDFILSVQPLVTLDGAARDTLTGMIEAADLFSQALRAALSPLMADGEAREAVREEFYAQTQASFEDRVSTLTQDNRLDVARGWLADMAGVVMTLFDVRALPGLTDRNFKLQKSIVEAYVRLRGNLAGHGPLGRKAFAALEIEPAEPKGKAA